MKILKFESPNFTFSRARLRKIKFIIIHYTGMQSTIESLKRLLNKNSKVSSHYLISREGRVFQLVDDKKIAWHAGKSRWGNNNNLNRNSIGIELQNKGHKLGYQSYPKKQINALVKLCSILKKKYKISSKNILGHSDVAPLRKMDPGEKFPWDKIYPKKITNQYGKKKINNFINSKSGYTNNNINFRKIFFKNLYKIGYRYFSLLKKDAFKDRKIIIAFQSKHSQRYVTGKINKKTLIISHLLKG